MIAQREEPKVHILVLNWNGWADTIECLESVFRLDYPNYQVIVCDNGSDDDSLARITTWAEGRLEAGVSPDHPLRRLSYPPRPTPIREDRLILIQTGANLGFAGGNNVGLRYVLEQSDVAYVWLLNNDTVVEPDALTNLVRAMREKPGAGLAGSTLLDYREPTKVQTLGGASYNRWVAIPRHIGAGLAVDQLPDTREVEERLAYVEGASTLVSRAFLNQVGLLSEDYFLYYEELDWATRAKGQFSLAYAPDSIVYHKEGRSIGSSADARARSLVADYYGIRNRLIFTRKHYPWFLPTVYLWLLVTLANRARQGQWDRAWMVAKIALNLDGGRP